MGLLDQYQAFARINPEARNIANEMSAYMNAASLSQKKQLEGMLQPANSSYSTSQKPYGEYSEQVSNLFNKSTPVGSFLNFVQTPNDIPGKIASGGNK